MKETAEILVDIQEPHGVINRNIYAHFFEHFDRCIYGGVFDPGSPHSAEFGFRRDVVDALRNIKTPMVRWPGGNFVSSYRWLDGIGKNRPVVYEPNWRDSETNLFGTDEFVRLCKLIGAEPLIVVNMGDGCVREASSWVEYCNLESGTKYASLRDDNGYRKPYNVKYWGLGNEAAWPHQVCAYQNVEDYIKEIMKYSRSMKHVDPDIKLVACGYGILKGREGFEWNQNLLLNAGQYFDYISVHDYCTGGFVGKQQKTYEETVEHSATVETELKKLAAQIDIAESVGITHGGMYKINRNNEKRVKFHYDAISVEKNRIKIFFDEWNFLGWASDLYEPIANNDINSKYTLVSALYTASILNVFHRMANKVEAAHYSPTVNGRGLIYADEKGVVLRPAYHVFKLYSDYCKEISVVAKVHGPRIGDYQALDVSATVDKEFREMTLVCTNRHPDKDIRAEIFLPGFGLNEPTSILQINAPSLDTYNDHAVPDAVRIVEVDVDIKANQQWSLPAHSITLYRIPLTQRTIQ